MLQAISPAVEDAKKTASEPFNSSNSSFVSSVTQSNVLLNIQKIIHKSESLNELNSKGKIAICGGIYSINNGIVNWL
jgi:carbonic anhydrase